MRLDSIVLALIGFAATGGEGQGRAPRAEDPRSHYDVQAYRLDLAVDPQAKRLKGTVAIEAEVTSDTLATLVLDLQKGFDVTRVSEIGGSIDPLGSLDGKSIAFRHEGARLACQLSRPVKRGARVQIAVSYSGQPSAKDSFEGFHWKKTADGRPWISTSCQGEGSSSWWPCKDSFFHPEDKPERTFVNLTVPLGLFAVSNGRLTGRETSGELETFHWAHEYPCETYAITLDVAPYVVVEQPLKLDGLEEPLNFTYYAVPEDALKAKLQFEEVPRMLAVYTQYFGPFPFPKSKYALVQTTFWGMEHSSAVAYGSSFPAWCQKTGQPDRHAASNQFFDYILIHESAHEWWGNAVSAKSWGHFWIHEGFATYAEGVYVEETQGREAAARYFASIEKHIDKKSRLYRGDHVDSEQAYATVIYYKGAWVLHTLRHYVDDDAAWWRTIKAFNLEFRYKNADTDDFRGVLERETQKSWKPFFDEWVYGTGYPEIQGRVALEPRRIVVDVDVGASARTEFHVPLEITWREGAEKKRVRPMLAPGRNQVEFRCSALPTEVACPGLDHVLGHHAVRIE